MSLGGPEPTVHTRPTDRPYEVVVIGAGHNGLVAAAYLARAGVDVAVCEARPLVGGQCVTEELVPGFRFSSAAVVIHLMRPQIMRDLELTRFGLVTRKAPVDRVGIWHSHPTLILKGPLDSQLRELRRFSDLDAVGMVEFGIRLRRFAALYEPIALVPPPSFAAFHDLVDSVDERLFDEFVTGSIGNVVDHYFSSPEVRSTLTTLGMVSVDASPESPGTGYVYGYHSLGGLDGDMSAHGYVLGGMGGLTKALAASATAAGATILTDAPVRRILVDDGGAVGVELSDDRVISARSVVSNLDPRHTLLGLVGKGELDANFAKSVADYEYAGAMARVHLALAELPRYESSPHTGSQPTDVHRGVTHLGAEMERFSRAHAAQSQGEYINDPVIEVTIPSAFDPTLAPRGKHTMTIGIMHTPYTLTGRSWADERERFGDIVVERLCTYAPNLRHAIIGRRVMTPLDVAETFGATGANIFHGTMSPEQIFSARPVPGWSAYRTPIERLYLCGSGTHPGGAVSGAPGHNAAAQVLRDRIAPPRDRSEWIGRAHEVTRLRPPSRQGALLHAVVGQPQGRRVVSTLARSPLFRPVVQRASRTPG